ncbi:MAG: hypothetical protein ACTSUE_00800, partial [Promethearchaeota archaeon]
METAQEIVKTTKDMDGNINPVKISSGLLIGLLGLQLSMIPWILNVLLTWTSGSVLGEGYALYLILASLMFSPIISAMMLKLATLPRFAVVAKKLLIYVALAGQLLIDWLVYAKIHSFFPFSEHDMINGTPIGSGWISSEVEPMNLLSIWMAWAMLFVIPVILACLASNKPRGSAGRQSMHVGMLILGITLALRWGGSWSAPYHHFVITAGFLPALVAFIPRTIGAGREHQDGNKRVSRPIFSTAGLLFMLGFCFGVPLIQSGNHLDSSLAWLALALSNALILLHAPARKEGWLQTRAGRACAFIGWVV